MRVTIGILVGVAIGAIATGAFLHRRDRHGAQPASPVEADPQARSDVESDTRNSQLEWFKYFHGFYASMERLRQYGVADERSATYAGAIDDFVPIEDVTDKIYGPARSDGLLSRSFLYYGARMAFLAREGRSPLVHAMDYHGSADFVRSADTFDTLLALDDPRPGPVVHLAESAGLSRHVLDTIGNRSMMPNGTYYTPYPLSTGDLDGDGIDDLAIGGRLFTSRAGFAPSPSSEIDGREIAFFRFRGRTRILAPSGDRLDVYELENGAPKLAGAIRLRRSAVRDRPYSVFPLDGALRDDVEMLLVISGSALDLYALREDWTVDLRISSPAPQPGEFILGARGDFDGDGIDDVWTAEQRWKDDQGQTVGRAMLLSSRLIAARAGATSLEDVAATVLYGSARYTNYDGIGASLSPVAGDLDGDGRPDLSIPGHRHMSEAGALFVLFGRDMPPGAIDVTDPRVIKVVGRPVSQLGPPFRHYDAFDATGDGRSDIVISADNDLCSGVSAGAIYVLDGAKISR